MPFWGLFICFFLLKVTGNAGNRVHELARGAQKKGFNKKRWGWHSSGQDVFPENQRVDLNTPVHLNCTANESIASVQWWRRDSAVTATAGRVTVDQWGTLRIAAATWSDIGEYTCIISLRNNTFSASAALNITGTSLYCVESETGMTSPLYRICKAACGCGGGN